MMQFENGRNTANSAERQKQGAENKEADRFFPEDGLTTVSENIFMAKLLR